MNTSCKLFLVFALLAGGNMASAQNFNFSNKGKEFWVGYGHHQFMETGSNTQNMVIYLSAEQPARVTVTLYRSGTAFPPKPDWSQTLTIPANTVVATQNIPKGSTASGPPSNTNPNYDARLFDYPIPLGTSGEGLWRGKGLHIVSDVPIVAYAHIYGSVSSGATMLMPVDTWGYSYTTLNSQQVDAGGPGYSWVYVMAKDSNTRVRITPAVTTKRGYTFIDTVLHKGEVYQIVAPSDGSGNGPEFSATKVKSVEGPDGQCHPIAVFAGSSRTRGESVPCGTGSGRDNDMQQLFPEHAWGQRYLTAPWARSSFSTLFPSSTQIHVYKVAVKDPTTVVTRNGVPLTGLIRNTYYQFSSGTADYIEADKPIMIAQFASNGSGCNPGGGSGDPEMVYLSPIEQAIKRAGFYRNTEESIHSNWLTLVIPTAGLPSLRIDGAIVSGPSTYIYNHPNLAGYSVVNKGWPAAQAQAIVSSDYAFNATTYGLGSAESYAYNAGTNIFNLAAISSIKNVLDSTATTHTYTCRGTPIELSALVFYKPTKLVFHLSALGSAITPNADITMNSPVPVDSPVVNGIKYYKYKLPGTYTFNTPGTFNIPLTATSPTIDNCSRTEPLNIQVEVRQRPVTDFTFTQTAGCGNQVCFNSPSLAPVGFTVKHWRWEIPVGGTTDSTQFPCIVMPNGTYQVRHKIITNEGCLGDTTKQITVNFASVNPMTVSPNATICVGDGVTLTASGATTYSWSPASGLNTTTGPTVTASPTVTTIYTVTGVSGGCSYSKQVTVTVNPSPAPPTVTSPVTYCQGGATAPLSATATGGNTLTWYNNSGLTGGSTTPPTPSTATAGSTTYWVTQKTTGSPSCESDAATIVVNVVNQIANNNVGPAQVICSGTAPDAITSSSSLTGGDGTYTYQWERSIDGGATWTTIAGATSASYTPPNSTGTIKYRRVVTSGFCTNTSNDVEITIQGSLTDIDISANQTICDGQTPANLVGQQPIGGDGTFTYQWESSSDNTNWSAISGATSKDYQPGALSDTMYYRRKVVSGICSGISNVVTIIVNVKPNGAISGAPSICEYDSYTVSFQASAGSSPFNVQLFVTGPASYADTIDQTVVGMAPATINVLPVNSTPGIYSVAIGNLTDPNGCSRSGFTPIVFTVHPKPVLTLTPDQAICAGSSTTLTAGGATTYSWTPATGLNTASGPTVVATPTVNTRYFVTGYSEGCSSMDSVDVTVNPVPAKPTVTSPITYCQNGTAVPLTGTGAAGNTLTWYDNAALTNGSATPYIPSTATAGTFTYYVTQTTPENCRSAAETITITVLPSITNNTIGADQEICAGSTANPISGPAGTGTLTLQPANNNQEWSLILKNGVDESATGYLDIPIEAWTHSGNPLTIREIIKFNLSGIPATATIQNATLSLFSYPTPTVNGNLIDANLGTANAMLIQKVATNWTAPLTWAGQPAGSTTNQVLVPHTTQPRLDLNVDVTAMVASMVNTNTNYGFLLKLQNEVIYNSRIFVSSYNTTYPTKHPKLVVTYSAAGSVPVGGTGTFTYQWQQSTDGGTTWTDVSGATAATFTPPATPGAIKYRRVVTSGPCTNTSNVVTITHYPALINTGISASQTVCEGTTPALLNGQTASGGNGTINYQWQSSPNGSTWTDISGATTEDYQPAALTSNTHYRRKITSGACVDSSNVVLITVTPKPNGAITGSTVCEYDAASVSFTSSAGTAPYTVVLTVTGPGGYSNTITQSVSASATIPVLPVNSAPGTYNVVFTSLTDNNNCVRNTGLTPVTITVNPKPVLTVSPNASICQGSNTTLTVTGATTYTWSPATGLSSTTGSSVTANPTATTIYTVTGTSNGCNSTGSVTVTVNPVPAKPTVTTPVTYCQNGAAVALSATAAAGNTLTWYDNAGLTGGTSTPYTPSTATAGTVNYYVTQTNSSNCTSQPETIVVTVQPSITGNTISADQLLCAGAASTPIGSTNAPTGGTNTFTYQWQSSTDGGATWNNITGATALTYNPGIPPTSTQYRRQAASGMCTSTSNVVTVAVQGAVSNTGITGTQSICNGSIPTLLDGQPAGPVTYQWESSPNNTSWTAIAGATTEDYQPGALTATTYYRRKVSNGACSDVSNTVTVTVQNLPMGSITGTTACEYDAASVNFASSDGVSPFTVRLSVTGPGGYSNTITQVMNGAGSIAILPANSAPGSYTVAFTSITDNNGCVRSSGLTGATINITARPVLNVPPTVPNCEGTSTTLTASGATTYTWSPATGLSSTTGSSVTANPSATTTYTVTGTSNGCSSTANVTVTVNPRPDASFTVDNNVCQNSQATFVPSTTSTNVTSWNWDFGDGTGVQTSTNGFSFTRPYGTANTFHVKLVTVDANGCVSDTARKTIQVRPLPDADFTLPTSICMPNGVAKFTNTSTISDNTNLNYSWDLGDQSAPSSLKDPSHVYPANGPYNVTLTATSVHGCKDIESKILGSDAFFSKPVAQFQVTPDALCQGVENVFTDQSTAPNSTVTAWRWNFDDGSPVSTVRNPVRKYKNPGTYEVSLVVTNAVGCVSDTARKEVTVYLQPVVDAGPSFVVTAGTIVTFKPKVNDTTLAFTWTPSADFQDPNQLSQTLVAFKDQKYTLTAVGDGGCTAWDTLVIKILNPVSIPNAFSPNGDGINDTWEINYLKDYPGAKVQIFNRYGQQIYQSYGYSRPWDGTYNGKPMPVATYYYIVTLSNGFAPISGSVTIVK